jgi:hypothetical protein
MENPESNKDEVIQRLIALDNPELIDALILIKNSQSEQDWAQLMTEREKHSPEKGITDANEGRVHSSQEFWKKIHGKS